MVCEGGVCVRWLVVWMVCEGWVGWVASRGGTSREAVV